MLSREFRAPTAMPKVWDWMGSHGRLVNIIVIEVLTVG
jgi:hypothetical protein